MLAGKFGSRRHSTTSFSENVVVAKTSYQMLGISSFSDRERALREISVQHLLRKKYNEAFRGVYFQRIGKKT